MALPGKLLQPLMDCVTEYVPGVDTVMDVPVAPLLHNKEPVKSEAVSNVLPQSLVAVTVGVATAEVKGSANPFPAALVHPFMV